MTFAVTEKEWWTMNSVVKQCPKCGKYMTYVIELPNGSSWRCPCGYNTRQELTWTTSITKMKGTVKYE